MIYLGDCVEVMASLPEASIDAIVTDPPYGLGFMGNDWDVHREQEWHERWAREALRVLKPGGHLLAFGGTRTFHRLATAIEESGFEIRDTLSWLYGSGFPKSYSHLKPAWEPIVFARKPLIGTVAANVAEHGTGALNIDAARIGTTKSVPASASNTPSEGYGLGTGEARARGSGHDPDVGRWPANVVLDEEAAALLDEQAESSVSRIGKPRGAASGDGWGMTATGAEYADSGGPSRFFYTAKASRNERELGLRGHLPCVACGGLDSKTHPTDDGSAKCRRNDHPTVKPVALMGWLVSLVLPPGGGTILDPFTGSGTTGVATLIGGGEFIGIDQEQGYVDIARWRIAGRDGLEKPPPPPPPPPEGQQAFSLE